MTHWVYTFGCSQPKNPVQKPDKMLLGGKGAGVAEMTALGIPVPPGFILTTDICTYFYKHNKTYPDQLEGQVKEAIVELEKTLDKKFGDAQNPLLVSVRSGAPVSMPGMMDTVLNLGLNDETLEGVIAQTGNARFAYDSYRRFIQMYANVVMDVGHYQFEQLLEEVKNEKGVDLDTDLTEEDLQRLIKRYRGLVKQETGKDFPQDVHDQLRGAIGAVFSSWMNARAVTYRKINHIDDHLGTAVTVQSMVFGNMGEDSATGVAFTRNPSTGENVFFGEYLINAQGEDVVAGIRTPQSITKAGRLADGSDLPSLEEAMPDVYQSLNDVRLKLEQHYKEMQDIEFTVERGRLWLLQARNGKRSARAAIKIAVDLVDEGILTKEQAVLKVNPASLDQLLHPIIDPDAPKNVIGSGLPASPGAVSGVVVFDADTAFKRGSAGEDVILVRPETSPEDIHGMHAAKGILTSRGGMTSHAAVVARGMGKTCVVGASKILIDTQKKAFTVGGVTVHENDTVTLIGDTGEVLLGAVKTIEPEFSSEMEKIMAWADGARRLDVRANAETPKDVKKAREFGAQGIGLCRTEHMFFDDARILTVRKMILAADEDQRRSALSELLPVQRADFDEIFTIMEGLPITVRLLDPPLHEFMPRTDAEFDEVSKALGLPLKKVKETYDFLHEMNPMLGHRGCRLGVSHPEIYEMQVRALFEAAHNVKQEKGFETDLEIMIPLVSTLREAEIMHDLVMRVHDAVASATGATFTYKIGTMIELPRAALRAEDIAQKMCFFSFGTNDLTQTTFGLSRDDAVHFLGTYEEQEIFKKDPFMSLDQEGVGELMHIAFNRGKKARGDLKTGICGEHGGDPDSVKFCHQLGLDYVSCSPYRVPIARLAAAHGALESA